MTVAPSICGTHISGAQKLIANWQEAATARSCHQRWFAQAPEGVLTRHPPPPIKRPQPGGKIPISLFSSPQQRELNPSLLNKG
jgi:hypothetical protein